jgi:hypothetical protein
VNLHVLGRFERNGLKAPKANDQNLVFDYTNPDKLNGNEDLFKGNACKRALSTANRKFNYFSVALISGGTAGAFLKKQTT